MLLCLEQGHIINNARGPARCNILLMIGERQTSIRSKKKKKIRKTTTEIPTTVIK